MKKIIFGVLSFFISMSIQAKQIKKVSVSVPIDGRSISEIRYLLKYNAQLAGIEVLPRLVSGKEAIRNNKFSDDIKALSIGAVNVNIISEEWNRSANKVSMLASVELDKLVSEKLLRQLSLNQKAKKQLENIYKKITSNITVNSTEYMKAVASVGMIKSKLLLTDSIEESITAKEELISHLNEFIYFNYLLPYIAKANIEFIAVDKWSVKYEVLFNELWGHVLDRARTMFESDSVVLSLWSDLPKSFVCIKEMGIKVPSEREFIKIKQLSPNKIKYSGKFYHWNNDKNLKNIKNNVTLLGCDRE